VDYNPLKGMLVLIFISSLKLSIVPYTAGTESRGHSRTEHAYINQCQTASKVSLFVGFLISCISLSTQTKKIGSSQRIKVISQYM